MLEFFKRKEEEEQGILELTRRRDVLRWNSYEYQMNGKLLRNF